MLLVGPITPPLLALDRWSSLAHSKASRTRFAWQHAAADAQGEPFTTPD